MPVEQDRVDYLSPAEVKRLLTGSGEIAFLDIREHGQYGEGHPFLAVPVPYSRLELAVRSLLPRRDVTIVLLDDGDGVTVRASGRLSALGYTDIKAVEGGAPGWRAAGFSLFRGVNVPSKTLGELVEEHFHTPRMTAAELAARKTRGEPLVQLDGRPVPEYRRMTIPGSRCCPNAELGHRLPLLVPDDTTPVIVNCAGRTRSIIGAQSLINIGVRNPVYALENGTQGWMLAGLDLEHGADRLFPAVLGQDALAVSLTRARGLRERFNIPVVDEATLDAWAADKGRTLYCFDVRTDEEFGASHHPRALHAPGGQLVQATDQWVAVRGARIVLLDDTGLRAASTAVWLRAMGHDACVLDPHAGRKSWRAATGLQDADRFDLLPECSPAELVALKDTGTVQVVDLNPSVSFRRRHLNGSRWSIRPRLAALAPDPSVPVVVVCDTPAVAGLAAVDLRELGCSDIRRLSGSLSDWEDAGLEISSSPGDPADGDAIDYLFFVHDRHDGNLQAARDYLSWEQGLLAQLDPDERAIFRL